MTNFSDIASNYERNSLVQRSASDRLFDLIQIKENEDVLDLGCGTGNLAKKIREMTSGKVLGMDASAGMINEAKKKYSSFDISFAVYSADHVPYEDSFDVIFCNSTFQWFKNPDSVLGACLRILRHNGRMGIQAPARKVYSPNFIEAIESVQLDFRLKDQFSSFEIPWFFLDTAEEYKLVFEHVGFDVLYAHIDRIVNSYSPEEVFAIFDSGAAAGYLNQEFYRTHISNEYVTAFKEVVRNVLTNQANADGYVDLTFFRVYLLARKP
jgi:ubiquinone/menaquinone biosynthesis C-methylase UbiE